MPGTLGAVMSRSDRAGLTDSQSAFHGCGDDFLGLQGSSRACARPRGLMRARDPAGIQPALCDWRRTLCCSMGWACQRLLLLRKVQGSLNRC